ncbi:carbonic anhydrase [Ferribacterium limneticum]|uniref:carbonic anhydrase n=1 Tax=Ferribacterium limneticum TaxID=76259 RepID=UPI001CFA78DB|nr:carbonic anhydrase family protein [Ferribacterium limneticum]UCV18754.1 carbonic anhydrase family protein [Ferribacterium limneticum]
MRLLMIASLLVALPFGAAAAPAWQTISAEPGKRIELNRTSLKRDGNIVEAQGRVVLEKELVDGRSGAPYRVIEAFTRYDCSTRSANTIKRVFKKNENDVVREEEIKGADLPVRTGTLDDKVLREVCRPPKEGAAEIAQKANEAAGQLKAANEAMLKKEMAKAEKPDAVKASDAAHGAAPLKESAIPSIRPNLKAAMEGAKESAKEAAPPAPPPPAPTPAPAKVAAPKAATVVVHTSQAPAPKPKKAPKPQSTHSEGYMLELAHSEPAVQHAHIHWDYEGAGGPENWSKLDQNNKVCAIGQRQSPIDIKDGIKVDLEPIKFNYQPSTFRIIDNGHTVQVEIGESSISLTGKTYELVQFHFHRPSEEKVNGQRFDMVAHLVHKADDGQLAVVAVLLERGTENAFIQTLWNNMPLEKNLPVAPPTTTIDLNTLLPTARNYYTYMGSLTTPPCSEGVLWLVMKQPVQVSPDQINIFSRLYKNNARPIQPSGGRLIKEGR